MSSVDNRQQIVQTQNLQLPYSNVHFKPSSQKVKKVAHGAMLEKQHSTSSIVKRKLPQQLPHIKSPSASDSILTPISRLEKAAYPILSRSLSKTQLNPMAASSSSLQIESTRQTPFDRMYAFLKASINKQHPKYSGEKKDFLLMLLTLDNETLSENSASSQNLLATFSLFKDPLELFSSIYRALKVLKRAKNHDFDRELLVSQKRTLLKFVNLFVKNNLGSPSTLIFKNITDIIENEILPYALKNAKKETKKICNEIKASIESLNSIHSTQRRSSITTPNIRTPDSSPSSSQTEELKSFSKMLDNLFQSTKLSKKDVREAAITVSSDLKTLFQSSLLNIDTSEFLNPNVEIINSFWTVHTNNVNKAFEYIKKFLRDTIYKHPLRVQNYLYFFAQVANESLNNRDFESAFCTYMALHSVSNEFNIQLSRDTKKILTGCELTFAVQKNFSMYRDAVKKSSSKSTVFLSSVLAKDITFAIDGNRLPQRINVLADLLRTISLCQTEVENEKLSPITNIGSLIENTPLDSHISKASSLSGYDTSE